MNYNDTQFKDLQSVCAEKYGNEKGLCIYSKAEDIFQKMQDEADYRNSDIIKWHMAENIFPVMAYYMALLEYEFSTDDAYANTLEEMQKHAMLAKEKNKVFAKIPFAYFLFKLGCRKVMGKYYPNEGWETDWVRYDKEEIHFNLKKCVYFEVTSQYGHPELCAAFCANDTTRFSGYLPNIKFERSGTVATGMEYCDFHFKNGKYL